MTPRATVDFETRSACTLRSCGAWKYSLDPTTEVLCVAFRLPVWPVGETAIWFSGHPGWKEHCDPGWSALYGFLAYVQQGGPLEAHNASFERAIWENVLVPRYGFPSVPLAQWHCSAAVAASYALPRGLENVAQALGLKAQKDMAGHRLMQKMSQPRKSRKAEREQWEKQGVVPPTLLWHESCADLMALGEYCRQDVRVEAELSEVLGGLSPQEEALFHLDQRVNERGFQLDQKGVGTACRLLAVETSRLNRELAQVTNNYVLRATQRAQLQTWLSTEGVDLQDTQKATIETLLTHTEGMSGPACRALEILQQLGQSSTAKYAAMAAWMAEDGRVRGGLLYHGASTGRWTGVGIQPQNFPRGNGEDQETLWGVIHQWETAKGQRVARRSGHDNRMGGRLLMDTLASGLRGAIVAPPGRVLYVGDYASIEARVVLWLAGETAALEIFRRGQDIYAAMAESIYGRPCVKGSPTYTEDRFLGKVAILGLGYQMGARKFADTCHSYGITIDEVFAQQVVDTYRQQFSQVKQLWWGQEQAAIQALRQQTSVPCGRVTWEKRGRFLQAVLPSGRALSYPDPMVKMRLTPWGEKRLSLSFMGVDPRVHTWARQTTYGGCLVENLVQAIARDILAAAMQRCEQSGVYEVVLTVHDEVVAEADAGAGSVEDFTRLLTRPPKWAPDCPIAAESWTGTRYHK